MKINAAILFLALLASACTPKPDSEKLKADILNTEKSFEKMAAEKSISEAFYYYADSNAVIKRENDTLIIGKENIRLYYAGMDKKDVHVSWTPDFIDVSSSGDMAYTYGKYTWKINNGNGDTTVFKGVFHTVWQLQADRSWKYVWD
jgi:ketosteroid isomerase-like protein